MTRTNFIATNEQEHSDIIERLNTTIHELNQYTLVGVEKVDFHKLSTYSMERTDNQTIAEFDSLAVEKALWAISLLKDNIEELSNLFNELYNNRTEIENIERYSFDDDNVIIKDIIKESDHPMAELMTGYIDGKTSDTSLLSLIINTIEKSGHPETARLINSLY